MENVLKIFVLNTMQHFLMDESVTIYIVRVLVAKSQLICKIRYTIIFLNNVINGNNNIPDSQPQLFEIFLLWIIYLFLFRRSSSLSIFFLLSNAIFLLFHPICARLFPFHSMQSEYFFGGRLDLNIKQLVFSVADHCV